MCLTSFRDSNHEGFQSWVRVCSLIKGSCRLWVASLRGHMISIEGLIGYANGLMVPIESLRRASWSIVEPYGA